MSIINYEALENAINSIEKEISSYDVQEKVLILNFVRQRINAQIQQQKVSDTVDSHPLMRFASKFINKRNE